MWIILVDVRPPCGLHVAVGELRVAAPYDQENRSFWWDGSEECELL